MAKASVIDKTITALETKRADILSKANTEAAAIDQAILTLKAQRVKARVSRPRAVMAMAAEQVG